MQVIKRNGALEDLDINKIHQCIEMACADLENVSVSDIETNSHIQLFDGISTLQIHTSMIKSAAELISVDSPDYEYVAARLLLQQIRKESGDISFKDYIINAMENNRISPELLNHYNFDKLESAIDFSKDLKFKYLGLQSLYDRYLIRNNENVVIESPQHFFMRVSCGINLNESIEFSTERAIELYELYSNHLFLSSTPTLFNSCTPKPQMSSCYLNVFSDSTFDYENEDFPLGIMGSMGESALLSKHAGGVGSDFTAIRPSGSKIKGTNGQSSGVIPAIKIYNDTALFFNQGGKRKGSFAPYLETIHGDFEAFIDLKKPTGDERIRARDVFPYSWTPDLFMKRVKTNDVWSFFDSSLYPELHLLYGDEFETRYLELESQSKYMKQVSAMELWKKMIISLSETGSPMICFKDEHNRRSTQKHIGVIRSSNLCSEISEVTDDYETAVCNLGSINFGVVEFEDIKRIVPVAVRALDNVIDINFYPSPKAKKSNLLHRPIGLGIMGWFEYLVRHGIDFESINHLNEVDRVSEEIAYWAIHTSIELAKEKGTYPSYEGSEWSKGIFPIDTARSKPKLSDRWVDLRKDLMKYGIRNSLLQAIAPTATIANIVGTTPSIEPSYKMSFVKENLSGKFVVVDSSMRYNRPDLCKTAFDIDQTWIIKAAAVRQKWVDQAQSLNFFKAKGTRGRDISDWYFLAWELGLKSTYYLKNEINEVKHDELPIGNIDEPKFCSIDNPDCESCQ